MRICYHFFLFSGIFLVVFLICEIRDFIDCKFKDKPKKEKISKKARKHDVEVEQ